MTDKIRYNIESDPLKLLQYLSDIQALQDSERDAVGFLPGSAIEDAILRRKLIAAFVQKGSELVLTGYLLYSGVFPHGKVQQIAIKTDFRKSGCASSLLRSLVSELERLGFLTLRADIANDLDVSTQFYQRNGFEPIREKLGGVSRGRKIIIHSRQLETESLLTVLARDEKPHLNLNASVRYSPVTPIFALDLNVYFDLAKERPNSGVARKLFGQALGHNLRLVVASEFVEELRKTSQNSNNDPVLQMALQLPRLAKPDKVELVGLADKIHEIIFVRTGNRSAHNKQALSDSKHVAHAALSKATAFVTRDGAILNARNDLLVEIGIDVVTADDVLDLLHNSEHIVEANITSGVDFEVLEADENTILSYASKSNIDKKILLGFLQSNQLDGTLYRLVIRHGSLIMGLGCIHVPNVFDPIAKLFVHVDQAHADAELFADYLIDKLLWFACKSSVALIQLLRLSGQTMVNRMAGQRGFNLEVGSGTFLKIAFGRPVTKSNWSWAINLLKRKTGVVLPNEFSVLGKKEGFEVRLASKEIIHIGIAQFETLIGPTVILSPKRDGVIVPIKRAYANELLGTSNEFLLDFMQQKEASFLSIRGYVNSPRTAKLMRPGSPVLFYESMNSGGRGVVAIAIIVNSFVIDKSQIDAKMGRALVVENLEAITSSKDVLITTFDNLMRFPAPVSFKKLKDMGAVGRTNLVSAQALTNDKMTKIVGHGWTKNE